jgi:hypothetical protein
MWMQGHDVNHHGSGPRPSVWRTPDSVPALAPRWRKSLTCNQALKPHEPGRRANVCNAHHRNALPATRETEELLDGIGSFRAVLQYIPLPVSRKAALSSCKPLDHRG